MVPMVTNPIRGYMNRGSSGEKIAARGSPWQHQAKLYRTMLHPTRQYHAEPGHTTPHVYQPSQTSKRQSGGMTPSRRAAEIMPR